MPEGDTTSPWTPADAAGTWATAKRDRNDETQRGDDVPHGVARQKKRIAAARRPRHGGVVKGSAIEGCGHFLPEECPAELIGVTADWYRYFESGRPVRVSPQFVSRLAKALRLQPYQEMTLFRLSFLEMYHLSGSIPKER